MVFDRRQTEKNPLEENLRGEVIKENGQWVVRLDEKGYLVLPDGLGRMMNLALRMEKSRRNDWNPNKIASTICHKFNCHKLTFFLLSTVLGDQDSKLLWQKAKKIVYNDKIGPFLEIDLANRVKTESLIELEKIIKDKLEDGKKNNKNNLALLQTWNDSSQGHYLVHSCLVGVDTAGRVICLEKKGLNQGKIQCVFLRNVVRRYREKDILDAKKRVWGVELVDNLSIDIAEMEMILAENLRKMYNIYYRDVLRHNLEMIQEGIGNVSVARTLAFLAEPDSNWIIITFNILEYLLEKKLIKREELISQVLPKINQFNLSDIREYIVDVF